MQQGRRSRTPRIDLYWLSNAFGHPRLAVIVPRYGATAVARNRLRRRLRERARCRVLTQLAALDLVVKARPEAYRAPPGDLAEDLAQWLCSVRA
jgi:ribonuclease P protein component